MDKQSFSSHKKAITIETVVRAPISRVWECWNKPEHVVKWAFTSDDWEAPKAENDLRVGGKFTITMAAKDKSASFDFSGVYNKVTDHELVEYDMDDGRHVKVEFRQLSADADVLADKPESVKIIETFDAENENPLDQQRSGWQAILDNFKKYAESI